MTYLSRKTPSVSPDTALDTPYDWRHLSNVYVYRQARRIFMFGYLEGRGRLTLRIWSVLDGRVNLMNIMECHESDGQDAATGKR